MSRGPEEPSMVELIDRAAARAEFEMEVGDAIRKSGRADPQATALIDAFAYLEAHGSGPQHFGPQMTFTDGTEVPPPLADAEKAVIEVWAATVDEVSHPMAVARLHDLLFESGHGRLDQHARTAAAAYLVLAERPSEISQDDNLRRALHLARKVNDGPLAATAIAQMAQHVRAAIERRHYGPVGRLLDALAADRSTPPEMDELIKLALASSPSADATEHLLRLQIRRVPPASRPSLERAIVDIWATEAQRHEGPVRAHHLQKAIATARDFGHSDLVATLTSELQQITLADYEFERFGVAASLPRQLEEHIDAFYVDRASTWLEAAALIHVGGPPSGDAEKNRRDAEASVHTSISANLPRTQIGGDGLPRWTPNTDEEMAESRLAETEIRTMQMNAGRMIRVLRRLHEHLGPLRAASFAEIADAQPHFTDAERDAIGRAYDHFIAGDFEASVAIAIPRIEAALRSMLLSINHPLYRTQRAKSPGQYPGLGALLGAAADLGLDESWLRFLSTFLTGGAGQNFRNELAHGFVVEPGPGQAAFTLLGLLWLLSLAADTEEPGNTETP